MTAPAQRKLLLHGICVARYPCFGAAFGIRAYRLYGKRNIALDDVGAVFRDDDTKLIFYIWHLSMPLSLRRK
jgi:hypothetical protein